MRALVDLKSGHTGRENMRRITLTKYLVIAELSILTTSEFVSVEVQIIRS